MRRSQSNAEYHRETTAQLRVRALEKENAALKDGAANEKLKEEYRQYHMTTEKRSLLSKGKRSGWFLPPRERQTGWFITFCKLMKIWLYTPKDVKKS